jgi:uroporphyrinogen-III synthase
MLPDEVEVLISPVMEIRPVNFSVDFDRYSTLVFSSGNGVRAAAARENLSGRRGIVVGDRTAEVARDCGMDVVSAKGGSQELLSAVKKAKPSGRVLLVRGKHTTGDVKKGLISAGIDTDSVVGYDQVSMPLSPAAIHVLRGERRVIIPLFSPRSAVLLAKEIGQCDCCAPLVLVAMSRQILAGWVGQGTDQSVVATDRTAKSLAREVMRQYAQWP